MLLGQRRRCVFPEEAGSGECCRAVIGAVEAVTLVRPEAAGKWRVTTESSQGGLRVEALGLSPARTKDLPPVTRVHYRPA